MAGLVDLLAGRIARRGPLPFDEVVDAALYHPDHGFYASGGAAGRRGDFVTSPEVGPLFGLLMARALDRWWAEMGQPDPFVVVEAGAGRGALARSILAAGPACGPVLRYVLVERSAALRARHGEHLHLVPPALAFGPSPLEGAMPTGSPARPAPSERADRTTGGEPDGPVCVSLPDLPAVEGPAVVLANELLDNIAFRVLGRVDGGWREVRAGAPDADRPEALSELAVPIPDSLAAYADRLVGDAPVGARIPLQDGAAGWLRSALDAAGAGGRVAVIDYCATTTMVAHRPWTDWLRTYAGHQRGGHPLDRLGAQDITADVCVDQLARVQPLATDRTQADVLHALGIDDLVEEGRRMWHERAHIGDLAAVRARSRVTEAAALTDPAGLGAFRVLEWHP